MTLTNIEQDDVGLGGQPEARRLELRVERPTGDDDAPTGPFGPEAQTFFADSLPGSPDRLSAPDDGK